MRQAVRLRQYSHRTEEAYASRIKEHRSLGERSLTQALSALLFLYRNVLHQDVAIGRIARPKGVKRLPVVLTRDEVRRRLARLEGTPRLVALLLYGSGLRVLEALQLRVKDLDLQACEIRLRRAKGGKDRVTMLTQGLIPSCGSTCSIAGACTIATWLRAAAWSHCRGPWPGSRRRPRETGGGSTSSRRAAVTSRRAWRRRSGITCTSRRSSRERLYLLAVQEAHECHHAESIGPD